MNRNESENLNSVHLYGRGGKPEGAHEETEEKWKTNLFV